MARQLLYMQSELLGLKTKLDRMDEAAVRSHDPVLADSLRMWETILDSVPDNDEVSKRKDLTDQIEVKLDKYRGCCSINVMPQS